MRYLAWIALGFIFRRLPLRVSYAVADVVGAVTFACWPRGRRNMAANYAVVLPHASRDDRERIAKRSLQNYCRYLVDFMRLPGEPAGARALVEDRTNAYARLEAAMARNRGVLVVCMHFGNWDLGAGATAARGVDAAAIAERFGDDRLDAAVFGARERLGLRILPLGATLLPAVRQLKSGGVLAILLDRPTPGEGVVVRFFGRDTEVPAGPARLAIRTGCAVAVAAFPRVRRGEAVVQVVAEFGLEAAVTGVAEPERALTQAILSAHERSIRRWPDQWYMFRAMWPGEGPGA